MRLSRPHVILAGVFCAITLIALTGAFMQPMALPATSDQVQEAGVAADQNTMRVGIVTGYTADGKITVAVSGTNVLVQATYLASYFPTVGDQVVVMKSGASWVVLGTMGNTQSRLVPVTNFVATNVTVTSATYVPPSDAAGPTVTALIGASGTALVTISILGSVNTAASQGTVGIRVTGATSIAPTDQNAWLIILPAGSTLYAIGCSYTILLTGLTPGSNTFSLEYRNAGGAGAFTAQNRLIVVTPY